MERIRKLLSFSKRRPEDKEMSEAFMRNGSVLLEKLLASFHGRHEVPIHSFTAREIIRAINISAAIGIVGKITMGDSDRFRGSLRGRPIIVQKLSRELDHQLAQLTYVINDIVINSQMNQHKNVLKLLGCCLEFECPSVVHEYPAGAELLSNLLYHHNEDRSFSWIKRLAVASDLASAILFLHTALRSRIIYRDINPDKIIVDQHGVAKLFDFSMSISLPPGELQVEDRVMGRMVFIDPEYLTSGFVSQKSDVYSFGVLMLVLLTGQQAHWLDNEGYWIVILEYVNGYIDADQSMEVVDSRISKEEGDIEQVKQMQSFLTLALKCVAKGEDRPDMIEVAREVRRIERSARPVSSTMV